MIQIQPQYKLRNQWEAFAAEQGLFYEALEFSMPPLINDPASFEDVKSWYRNSGRVSSVHGAFIDVNPVSGDNAFRELSRRRIEESCKLACELHASAVVLHGSCFPFLRGAFLDSWADDCAAYYSDLAHRCHMTLCIENSLDVDTTPMKELMRRAEDPLVRMCLDVGHAAYSDAPIEQWFGEIGEYITYIHLSDNCGSFDDHMALGSGRIDWRHVDTLWRGIGAPERMTIEVRDLPTARQSLRYLCENHLFGQESVI